MPSGRRLRSYGSRDSCADPTRKPLRMCGHELLRLAEVLRRVDRHPDAGVPVTAQLSLRGELGEGALLVVSALREPVDRLVVEDVDPRVDPVFEQGRLTEAGYRPAAVDVDDAERRAHLRDDDRRRGTRLAVLREERGEVDVEQLVAVQREHGPVLVTAGGGEAQPAAAAERLGLADELDLCAERAERVLERGLLAGAAGDDHPLDTRADESRDRVLEQRDAADRHERLR